MKEILEEEANVANEETKESQQKSEYEIEFEEVRESILFEKTTLENSVARMKEDLDKNKQYLKKKLKQEKFLSVSFYDELRAERQNLENNIRAGIENTRKLEKIVKMLQKRLDYLDSIK